MRRTVFLLTATLVVGCGAVDNPDSAEQTTTTSTVLSEVTLPIADVFFPIQAATQITSPAAELRGTLVEEDGCLWIERDFAGGLVLPLWPLQYRAVDRDGLTVVVDQDGTELARVGDEVVAGGGFVSVEYTHETVEEPVPARCLEGVGVWVASELEKTG